MDGRLSRILLVALAALLGAALFAPPFATAQTEDDPRRTDTVTVAAVREVDVEPDIGTVSLGVRVRSLTADGASDKLANRTRRVVNAIRALGFSDDEISTFDVELDRTCLRDCRDPNPRDNKVPEPVIGYRGSAGVRVETEQLDRLGEVIDAGISAGANSIRGVTFDVKDKSEAVKEALRQAMVFATDKARILAETGDRELGPAIIITEGRTQAPELHRVADEALAVSRSRAGSGGGGSNPFPVEPPTLSASARVQVTFELN